MDFKSFRLSILESISTYFIYIFSEIRNAFISKVMMHFLILSFSVFYVTTCSLFLVPRELIVAMRSTLL